MNFETKNDLEIGDITSDTSSISNKNKWNDIGNQWTKNCSQCNKQQIYTTYKALQYSIKHKKICLSCSKKSENLSLDTRKKLSDSHSREHHPLWGKSPSLSSRIQNSQSQIGSKSYSYGKKQSEDTKRKRRILMLKRKETLGIPITEDKGANDFFIALNKQGFNFQPTRFINLGYEADGYDEENHLWYEYDTPYHNTLHQQRKDLIRQSNIIQYFQNINNPLNGFVRIKVNETRNIINTVVIV